jgi:hypothetical protein
VNDDADDIRLFVSDVQKCMNCDYDPSQERDEATRARCGMCERYFVNSRLFLNNVG